VIDLYYWPTPNGWKVSIYLEEVGLEYRMIPIDIGRGAQFDEAFLAISPNNRIPAIVDHAPADGGAPISVFESGAILTYLAEKIGKLLPTETRARVAAFEWLFWQVGGLGPMAGQAGHFRNYAKEQVPYAIDRYTKEYGRLLGVADQRLREREYLAGDYSIADVASFPWVKAAERLGQDLGPFPNVRRWFDAIEARPAVIRGLSVGKDLRSGPIDDQARAILFGQTARTR
jgi:GST-like protein